MHRFLCVQETPGHRIVEQHLPLPLEFRNFVVRELNALRLLVLEVFAPLADQRILRAGFIIDHELIHAEAMGFKFGL
jgi:hypothetical protein